MRDTLAWICIAIAGVLILLEFIVTLRPAPKAGDVGARDFPGIDVVKLLAEKSPRIAGALAFMLLAGVFAVGLTFEATTE